MRQFQNPKRKRMGQFQNPKRKRMGQFQNPKRKRMGPLREGRSFAEWPRALALGVLLTDRSTDSAAHPPRNAPRVMARVAAKMRL